MIAILLAAQLVCAHSGSQVNVLPGDSWQVKHMKLEHGYETFDAKAFFIEHDSDNSKAWDRNDIIRLYGLQKNNQVGDGSGMGSNTETHEITEETREEVYQTLMKLLDENKDGRVSMEEWRKFCEAGKELPDFGLGTGHHGDYEYEYEVHHWQEFHAANDPDVKVRHPEDEEHERLYHQYEHHDEGWGDHDAAWVRTSSIPKKFLKKRVEGEL